MLLLCSRSEEYNLWILRSLAGSHESQALAASSEQERAFRSGPFNAMLRQLIAYYINMVSSYHHDISSHWSFKARTNQLAGNASDCGANPSAANESQPLAAHMRPPVICPWYHDTFDLSLWPSLHLHSLAKQHPETTDLLLHQLEVLQESCSARAGP